MKKLILSILSCCLCIVCSGCLTNEPRHIISEAQYTYSEAENEPTIYITAPDGTRYIRDYYIAATGWGEAEGIFELNGKDASIGFCSGYQYKYIYATVNENCICLRDPIGECIYFFREGYELPELNSATIDKIVIYPKEGAEIDITDNDELKTLIIDYVRSNVFTDGIDKIDENWCSKLSIRFYDNNSGLSAGKTIYSNENGKYYCRYNDLYKSDASHMPSIYLHTKVVECTDEFVEAMKSYGFLD